MTEAVDPIARRKFPDEAAAWRSELEAIRTQIAPSDQLRIALVGTTGAGKSSLLNALLDQELLPVGVMEPCTAFVTVVRYRPDETYRLDIDFISEAEWRRDLESLVAVLNPGDDGDTSVSKRVIGAAKKRAQAVLGITIGENVSLEDLLEHPTPPQALQALRLTSKQSHTFVDPSEMLKHMRSLVRGESPLWPLVKQVTVRGPYQCLQGGIELVDLPGLNDANEARVDVTREFLRTSPMVWVAFSMVRGLTNDVQAILHEEKLLRTLILNGSYSGLSLIGTKADDIDVNAASQFGLEATADLKEVIREYRLQTVDSVRGQLEQMIRDLASPTDEGATLTRMLEYARSVEVQTTSAAAYCRLMQIGRLRKDYGIEDVEETGIPAVRELLRRIAREGGADSSAKLAIKRMDELAAEISFFFRAKATIASREVDRARAALRNELEWLNAKVGDTEGSATTRLDEYRRQLLSRVDDLLESSVEGVCEACQSWRDIHWATLRAIASRDGLFKSPSTGKLYDLNEALTDPLLNRLPVSWERYFTDDLGRVREEFVLRVQEAGLDFCRRASLIVELMFQQKNASMDDQLRWFSERISSLSEAANSQLLRAVRERRQTLAHRIPFVAKEWMLPAYEMAAEESGPGMKARMLECLERRAVESATPIYETIRTDLLDGLGKLEKIIVDLLKELAGGTKQQGRTVADNAAINIDESALAPEISSLLSSIPKPPPQISR